jgi:hypothetical protein
MLTVPIKVRSEILGMTERFLVGTVPDEHELTVTPSGPRTERASRQARAAK